MRMTIVTAAVAALGLLGCQDKREQVAQQQAEVEQEQLEFNRKAADERAEANRESFEAKRDAEQEIAREQRELSAERRELAEDQRELEREGIGGAGIAGTGNMVTGTVKTSWGPKITVVDAQGREMKLLTDEKTAISFKGKKVDIDDFSPGTEVQATYVVKENEKFARQVEILKPIKN